MVLIDLVRRLARKRPMRSGLGWRAIYCSTTRMRRADGVIRVQIDLLIFQAPPESFHEYVIPPAAFAVHADLNAAVFQDSRELLAGELTRSSTPTKGGAVILRDHLS